MTNQHPILKDPLRVNEVLSYHLMGEDGGSDFDFITQLAAEVANVSMACISLVSDSQHWNLSRYQVNEKIVPLEASFCAVTITRPNRPLIVEDSRATEQFKGNSPIRFYGGYPLVAENGMAVGALCVMDHQPHRLEEDQHTTLTKLANQVVRLLELRKKNLQVEVQNKALTKNLELLRETMNANNLGTWELDYKTGTTTWSDTVFHIHEVPLHFDHNKASAISFYHPSYQKVIENALSRAIEFDERFDVICLLITAKGNQRWVRSTGRKVGDKVLGSFQDITTLREKELKMRGIFNSTFSFIGFLNTQGVLLEANDSALKMANLKEEDVIGKYFWDCYWWQINSNTQEELKANFYRALQGQEVVYEVQIWVANQTPITILFSLKPVKNDQGEVIYVIPEGWPIQEIVDVRKRYQSVIEGTNVGTWEWNVQTGETIFNERWADIIGYTLEELQPININTWIKHTHPEDLKLAEPKLQACFEKRSEYYEVELRMKHKKGHWVWILDRGKVIDWTEDGKPLRAYGTHQEITQRKERELELNYQKDLLQALYQLSPVGIALNDYKTGKFLDVNDKLLEPMGYTKEEFMGLDYHLISPPEYQITDQMANAALRTDGYFGPYEKELIRKDGSRYPIVMQSVVVTDNHQRKLVWSIVQDVSKEKEVEGKMREALNRLQSILDASTQVAVIATDLDGKITLFNSGAEIMLNLTSDQATGKLLNHLLRKEDLINAAQGIYKKWGLRTKEFQTVSFNTLQSGSETREWSIIRADGSSLPVLLSLTKIVENQETSGFLGVAVNISQIKEVEREIKSLLAITKRQNNRLRNFAHIVSHNLRSHSSGILGLLDLLVHEMDTFKEHPYFQLLNQAANSLQKTVEDLTEVVRINLSEAAAEPVYLHKIIEKTRHSLSHQLQQASFNLENKLSKDFVIRGIPAYADSIVHNLVSNAIKYRRHDRESHLIISGKVRAGIAIITFEDNGLGLDLDTYGKHLFGLYKTFHNHPDARGVGLFITKNQVESMGGKITVESKLNQGTTFTLTLPV